MVHGAFKQASIRHINIEKVLKPLSRENNSGREIFRSYILLYLELI